MQAKAACAQGKQGENGSLCPYTETLPQCLEELQAWHVIASGPGVLKQGPMGGVTGYDWQNIQALIAAKGFDQRTVCDLIFSTESNLVSAFQNNEG